MNSGRLLGIAVRTRPRSAMHELFTAAITAETGCAGDARGKPGNRQVTVLSNESWGAACEDLGRDLPWTSRRANLLVEGINLFETTGARIKIGDLELQVMGETDPCNRMDEIAVGLRQALQPDWRGGVCCRVRRSGRVQVGDAVSIRVPR